MPNTPHQWEKGGKQMGLEFILLIPPQRRIDRRLDKNRSQST